MTRRAGAMAVVVQAAALIAVGLVLIVAAITAPEPPAEQPQQLRPATAEDRREYDRQLLFEELTRLRQQEGATALHKP
ncbi:hypothetical protein ACGFIP_32150 [Micromonospora zamorensis]|uniref:hypothetical protein n=1 Tax=Micromonospora zamorensis TaxID=709883 RepID=UPI00371A9A1B